MNDDDFREMELADSLDDSFSNTFSMFEIDSNPEDDFSGRNITVKTPPQMGRTLARDKNQQSKGRVWTRLGLNQGIRTWGFNHIARPMEQLASAVTDENQSYDQSSDSEQ